METQLETLFRGIRLGEPQLHRNMTVFPLFCDHPPGPEYLTLRQALEERLLQIGEVNENGSVSQLRVENQAGLPVLLLDGEELQGAKQNRVLNSSVLVVEQAVTLIPVSCTEQGRWSYRSRNFSDSGNVLFHRARAAKQQSVSDSLEYSQEFASNQMQVWESITELQYCTGQHSGTAAMSDVFQASRAPLDQYLQAFPCREGQRGLLVGLSGMVAGYDLLSSAEAYRHLHEKLARSYAMEALLMREGPDQATAAGQAEAFLGQVPLCHGKKYKSPGHGWDWRLSGELVVGSVLAWQETAIHAAFFRRRPESSRQDDPLAGLHRRAGYRHY